MNIYKELLEFYLLKEEIDNNGKFIKNYFNEITEIYKNDKLLKEKEYKLYYEEFLDLKNKILSYELENIKQNEIIKKGTYANEVKKKILEFIEIIDFERLNIVINILKGKYKNNIKRYTSLSLSKYNRIVRYGKHIFNNLNNIIENFNSLYKMKIEKIKYKIEY